MKSSKSWFLSLTTKWKITKSLCHAKVKLWRSIVCVVWKDYWKDVDWFYVHIVMHWDVISTLHIFLQKNVIYSLRTTMDMHLITSHLFLFLICKHHYNLWCPHLLVLPSLIDPTSGEVIFSTSDPEWRLPQGLHTLEVDQAEVYGVRPWVETVPGPSHQKVSQTEVRRFQV
jgi:hypothetical protein